MDEEGNFTIFDWKEKHASRKWLWTAITRARSLDDVYFFNGESQEYNNEVLKKYFSNKIKSYKEQDIKAKRKIDSNEEYVDVEWFMDRLNNRCSNPRCETELNIKVENNYCKTNMTAERPNTSLQHYKKNCILYCLHCNVSKKKINN